MSGWEDLEPEAIAALGSDAFEEFCASLIRNEAYTRHDDPDLDNPLGRGRKDGGRDILLTVENPPTISRRDYQQQNTLKPLTEDPINGARTRTVYSCKTGKNWDTLALNDAKQGAPIAAEVLAEGGYFKLCVDQRVNKSDKRGRKNEEGKLVERTVAGHLVYEYERRLGLSGLDKRIEIIDANNLTVYLRQLQPSGGKFENWRTDLGLGGSLNSLGQWKIAHELDRDTAPELINDEQRDQRRAELLAWLRGDGDETCAALIGNPGVGKTRLVLEALSAKSSLDLAPRVRVALSPQDALEAIERDRLLQRKRDLILVVDDCLGHEVPRITTRFLTSMQERARLLLLIPSASDHVPEGLAHARIWPLAPLAASACRELVAKLLERTVNDADVTALADYAEGFPWFARLLSKEFQHAGVPPRTMLQALKWALASEREANSQPELEQLRYRRARALMAVSLTPTTDWSEIEPDTADSLARALDLDWGELLQTAHECVERGLLRRKNGWRVKYITPLIIEREIYRWLLGDDDPDPSWRRLWSRLPPALRSTLIDRVRRLPGLGALERRLSRALLAQMHASTLVELHQQGLLRAPLALTLALDPAATARALREAAQRDDPSRLRAELGAQHWVVRALEELASRSQTFEDAEAALFRLTVAGVASSPEHALGRWARLFATGTSTAPLSTRVDSLARHVHSEVEAERQLALHGLKALLSAGPGSFAHSVEAPPGTQNEVLRAQRIRAWSLLGGLIEDDDTEVAGAAKRLAVKLIRSAVHLGVGAQALALLEQLAPHFDASERVGLRQKLEELEEYEGDLIEAAGGSLQSIRQAFAPRDYAEHLQQRVGVWGQASLRDEDDALDDAIARAGLSGGLPLRTQLRWLVSPEAERAHVFAYAMGRNDPNAVLFEDLCELAEQHPDLWQAQALLARYLGGMHSDPSQAQRALELAAHLRDTPPLHTAAALTLLEFGLTTFTARWLEDALQSHRIQSFAIEELGRRPRALDELDDIPFIRLMWTLCGAPVQAHAVTLRIVVRVLCGRSSREAHAIPSELIDALLEQLATCETLASNTEYEWEVAAKLLHDRGFAERVAELAFRALASSGGHRFAWSVVHHAVNLDVAATLDALLPLLAEPRLCWRLTIAFDFHARAIAWPPQTLLDWIGDDAERSEAAASIVRVDGPELPAVLRELIRRFGPDSPAACKISGNIRSRGGVADDIVEHDRAALERAHAWSRDEDPVIAAFARKLVESLERSLERDAAISNELSLKYGT